MIRLLKKITLVGFGFVALQINAQVLDASHRDVVTKVRARVIVDNDFGGDPDGLFQLAHQLLCSSVEVKAIIGSHHYPRGFYGESGDPENACVAVNALLKVMDLDGKIPVYQGAKERIDKKGEAMPSAAARFIVQEAMKDDDKTPLYIACGAGLTDLASAYLLEPKIASKIRLIWIGGAEHEDIACPPPGGQRVEYNLGIDLRAAQVVFQESEIPIWQVPRDAYRQALVSDAELHHRMQDGRLAKFLLGRLDELKKRAKGELGETYVLGDSPLVLLTALQSSWEVDPSSSKYVTKPTPKIADQGGYANATQSRPMRIYTQLDTRLLLEDFYAKISMFDKKVVMKK